ncbi:MAG: hypothetical protein ACLPXW_17065, partial [Xanthobacteraceae bacterium]
SVSLHREIIRMQAQRSRHRTNIKSFAIRAKHGDHSSRRVWTPPIFLVIGSSATQEKHMPMPTYGQQTQNPVNGRRMVVSEVDKGGLWHLVLEQHPERIWMGLAIPGFELGERVGNIGKRRTVLSSGCSR